MLKLVTIQLIVLIINFYIFIIHIGTIGSVVKDTKISQIGEILKDSSDSGLTHIFLKGSPYNIGYENGRLLQKELMLQENLMIDKINDFIPSRFVQKLFFFSSMIWFNGIEDFIDNDSLEEMEGVSKWVSSEYDYLATPLTRQVAYHGIHEVGQMFVDEDHADMGCFTTIIKDKENIILGRNFDFDIDGNFDKNKIIKWVFPDQGIPYLSVIFPGMVGAVTGVNQKGIYVSINAGGSKDWKRVGTPTTIIIKQVLQKASTINEALSIIKNSQTFITDIFVIANTSTKEVYRIEKTPGAYDITKMPNNHVVSNHLESEKFINDPVNIKRQRDLTTVYRSKRGLELLNDKTYTPMNQTMNILRDKNFINSEHIHLGHRGSIDSMIASHSVILSFTDSVLYINEGPGTSGRYIGFDLDKSFKEVKPIVKGTLSASKDISRSEYLKIRMRLIQIKKFKSNLKTDNCLKHEVVIKKLIHSKFIHYEKDLLASKFYKICENNIKISKDYLKSALNKKIPFYQKVKRLQKVLSE